MSSNAGPILFSSRYMHSDYPNRHPSISKHLQTGSPTSIVIYDYCSLFLSSCFNISIPQYVCVFQKGNFYKYHESFWISEFQPNLMKLQSASVQKVPSNWLTISLPASRFLHCLPCPTCTNPQAHYQKHQPARRHSDRTVPFWPFL